MTGILSAQELARLHQAMLLGLARQPAPLPEHLARLLAGTPDPVLAALALAGQQLRFRPVPAEGKQGSAVPEAAKRLHEDPRPIMPEAPRRLLLRLANGAERGLADAVLSFAVHRVDRAGFRPHPFDLPRLVPHIKHDARCLGLAERAFLALSDNEETAEAASLLHTTITPESWASFPKGHRVAFLRAERRRDPAEARAMLEAVFKSEPAAIRGDLLGALYVGIGRDDLPFLESLSGDRAESVRTAASGLIARVPGTPAHASRLAEAAGCFARRSAGISGILSRIGVGKAEIEFKPPAAANPNARWTALAKLFDGFSVGEIAAAAKLAPAEMIGLVSGEEPVLAAFAARALADEDYGTILLVAEARLAASTGRIIAAAVILAGLAETLAEPVPMQFGTRLLTSEALAAGLERYLAADAPGTLQDDGTLVWTAALLPPVLRARFIDRITPLPPATGRTARNLAALLSALEAEEKPA